MNDQEPTIFGPVEALGSSARGGNEERAHSGEHPSVRFTTPPPTHAHSLQPMTALRAMYRLGAAFAGHLRFPVRPVPVRNWGR